jgi:hypothetical protein
MDVWVATTAGDAYIMVQMVTKRFHSQVLSVLQLGEGFENTFNAVLMGISIGSWTGILQVLLIIELHTTPDAIEVCSPQIEC